MLLIHFIFSFFHFRSMNTFLIIHLIILISEAIISTILKYTWQAEEKWDEPWYNQKTEHQRNSSKVFYDVLDSVIKKILFFGNFISFNAL